MSSYWAETESTATPRGPIEDVPLPSLSPVSNECGPKSDGISKDSDVAVGVVGVVLGDSSSSNTV